MAQERKKNDEMAEEAPPLTEETPAGAAEKIEGLETEVNETGPCKVEVKARIPSQAVQKELAKTFDELTPNATIAGFRRGHAPRRLVERHYHDTVLEDAKRLLIARSWEQLKEEHKIRPIGEPDLSDEHITYDEEKGLSYDVTIEVAPQFDVKDYKGLELVRPSTAVDEEEIGKTLENLRKRNAVLEPVEGGKTQQDDVPVVDCDIKVAGEVVQSVSDQEMTLGVDNWLRGLDAELWKDLLGKKSGESAVKTVTLPQTYQKEEYRGKEAEVTVTIKDIKRPRLPELNDDFAKDMLYENLEDLKKEVRERVTAMKEREARAGLARQVEEKLLEMVDFALPEELVQRMTVRTINRERLSLAYQGVPRDEIEKAAGQITEGAQKRTERDIRIYFILQQIADKEKIEVTENELERRVQVMAQVQNEKPARFRENLKKEGRLDNLRSELTDEKTVDFLIAQGKIKEAPAAAKPEKKPGKTGSSPPRGESLNETDHGKEDAQP